MVSLLEDTTVLLVQHGMVLTVEIRIGLLVPVTTDDVETGTAP